MYDRMVREHGYSIRKLADKLGKDKGYLENRLRLADAPPEVRELVSLRKDTLSHAYELMKVDDPKKRRRLAEQVARGELTLVKLRDKIEGRRPRPAADEVWPTSSTSRSKRRHRSHRSCLPRRRRPRPTRTGRRRPGSPSARTRWSMRSNASVTRSSSWSTCSGIPGCGIDPGYRPGEPRQVPDDLEAQARERDRDGPERRARRLTLRAGR